MQRNNARGALIEQRASHGCRGGGVEAEERLVGEQQRRLRHECNGGGSDRALSTAQRSIGAFQVRRREAHAQGGLHLARPHRCGPETTRLKRQRRIVGEARERPGRRRSSGEVAEPTQMLTRHLRRTVRCGN